MSNNKKSLWGNRGKHHDMSLFGKRRNVRRIVRPPQPPIPVRQPIQFSEQKNEDKEVIELIVGSNFTDEDSRIKAEEEARIKAEEKARIKAEEEARIKAEEEARIKAEEEARIKAEEEARIKAEEEARIQAEEEARIQAEEEARIQAEEEARIKAEEEARIQAEEEARIKAEEEEWQQNNLTPEEIEANKRYEEEEQETARLLALEEEQKTEPTIEEVYEEQSVSPGENLLSSNLDLKKASEEISKNPGSEEEVIEKIEEEEMENIKV